jgi:lipid-A-disaccharide synthase
VVAGEASGDLHAARLIEALRTLGPCEVFGVAGPALRAAGVEPLVRMEDLAMLGFAEIAAKLPVLLRARATLLRSLAERRPEPSCWWIIPASTRLGPRRSGAVRERSITSHRRCGCGIRARSGRRPGWTPAVVFPFEEPLFQSAGVRRHSWDTADGRARTRSGKGPFAPNSTRRPVRILGLPGSRPQEIERHLGVLVATALALQRDRVT